MPSNKAYCVFFTCPSVLHSSWSILHTNIDSTALVFHFCFHISILISLRNHFPLELPISVMGTTLYLQRYVTRKNFCKAYGGYFLTHFTFGQHIVKYLNIVVKCLFTLPDPQKAIYSILLNKRACTFSYSKGLWSALYALLDPTRLLKFTNFILLVNKNAIKCEFSCTFIRICPWTFILFQKYLTLDSY